MSVFRIHPSIGFARVGNSEVFYLAPESMAGHPQPGGKSGQTGGLPIRPGTESTTITSSDVRDKSGALKRQAARFHLFLYPEDQLAQYPAGVGTEITIGSQIGGRIVVDIVWTVHVANKKGNTYIIEDEATSTEFGISYYRNGNLPPLRNLKDGPDPTNAARIRKLCIDPGPRAASGCNVKSIRFDKGTMAAFGKGARIESSSNYPKSFPDDHYANLFCPSGPLLSLGEIMTDDKGRVIFVGGYGRAIARTHDDGTPFPLDVDVDNDGWYDDTSDGPVNAAVVFDDGTTSDAQGAWVVTSDPAYAPQTLNVVSLWDDVYDSWVRNLNLRPDIFDNHFLDTYRPPFDEELAPLFSAVALQQWSTNLPSFAINAHKAVAAITADSQPAQTIMSGLAYIRNPNKPQETNVGVPLMPLSLGDIGTAFLMPSLTQYFFMSQWVNGKADKTTPQREQLGGGEFLDKASLINCLGGRFSPGIELTFICRQTDLYINDWHTYGPFRIDARPMDYTNAQATQPMLTEGYVPYRGRQVEPGDVSKLMAIPWHTDYNSCATHQPNPNPLNNQTLYWSWPAQRPVAVYAAKDMVNGKLPAQRYSIRGMGTESENSAVAGRFHDRMDMIKKWHRIGIIVQGTAVDGGDFPADVYLEVESRLDQADPAPWPLYGTGTF